MSEHDGGVYGADLPRRTTAGVLGPAAGTRVVTRGDRRTSGGNAFSADGPSWCLSGSTRSWKIVTPDGASRELTAEEAGLLNGFPTDYPRGGCRTKQFLQVATWSTRSSPRWPWASLPTPLVAPVRAYLQDG